MRAARERLNLLLATNQQITTKDLSDAESPVKSVDSLLLAYKELLSIKYALTKPLSTEEAYALKLNKFMKYAMYERMTGISTGEVLGPKGTPCSDCRQDSIALEVCKNFYAKAPSIEHHLFVVSNKHIFAIQ